MATSKTEAKKAEQQEVVIAFKGFDANLQCRGFQYEVGGEYKHNGKVVACSSGFHACENPFDVWGYYGPFDSRFATVELSGDLSRETSGDSKIAAGNIKIKAELKLPEFIGTAVKWIIDQCKVGVPADASGDSAKIGSSGDYAQIGSSGDYAQIGSSGDSAKIGSSGNYAKIGSSGNSAKIGSSGNYAKIGSSGYSTQIDSTGADAVIACAGGVERFRVGPGGAIAVPYSDGSRTRFAVFYEGEDIKTGVWYAPSDSKPVEA